RPAARWCSTPPTACSSRAGWARRRAATGASSRRWRARRSQPASTRSSWRSTRTPAARSPTAPRAWRSPSCRRCSPSSRPSTGTPAFFLHAGEGGHGDVGTLVRGDVLLAVSNSGESEEVLRLLPVARRFGIPLVAISGDPDSTLARQADVALDVSVPVEACPLGLAPTASTTAAMALGDALALALLEERGFSAEDFALLHPGGALGRRLTRVEELMHRGDALPLVAEDT